MEDKVIQQSFTFKNSDRMTAQAKKTATNIQKRKWQVKLSCITFSVSGCLHQLGFGTLQSNLFCFILDFS